jgi:regulator of protease activity HflC (stomatin/prohibitin superfamily)
MAKIIASKNPQIMKKLALSFMAALALSACTTADSSEVALVVDQIGNDKGEPNIEMKSGFIFYFPFTQDVYKYPTSVQHKVWTSDTKEDSPTDEY